MVLLRPDSEDRHIEELYQKEEEELVQTLSVKYGLPFVDLTKTPIEGDALKAIPETEAREAGAAAFKVVGKDLYVAARAPQKSTFLETVETLKRKRYNPLVYMASSRSLERAWGRYKELSQSAETHSGVLDIAGGTIEKLTKEIGTIGDIKRTVEERLKTNKGRKVSEMLEIILGGAIATDSSDIHIEPEDERIRLRFRLNGVLADILFFDKDTYHLLVSRLKLLSGLKLNIKESAQDGRFSIKLDNAEIEIRASFVPGAYGESIVLRVLNPETIAVPFEELGIPARLMPILVREIGRPNGIILNTGPTGSGKTTTLYAFLKRVYSPGTKIITIEDPIEYHLDGITQTQTDEKKGYTFLEGLRSALRQDPDVMMVGEIRDSETAKIAINAALTGHLVFSTLHTNTAAGAIPRLIDLGVNPKVISSALNVALAQRLVRKLCKVCKKKVELSDVDRALVRSIIERAVAEGKGDDFSSVDTTKLEVYGPVGCAACNETGYKGRIGIYEAILMDEEIERVIGENPTEREIKKAAVPQRILDLSQDGILKLLGGITSLEELRRVLDIDA